MGTFHGDDHDELIRHGIRIGHVEGAVTEIRDQYVSKVENFPQKSIAYGIASIILTAFGVGIVSLVINYLRL